MRQNTVLVDVVRHGESTWNAQGLWQGQADPPLSDAGRRQAGALAVRYEEVAFDSVWSSDLSRAVETAATVASGRDLELNTTAALREMDVGLWAGLTRVEIAARFPEEWQEMQAGGDPRRGGGETRHELRARVRRAFYELVDQACAGGLSRVLLVTHGGVAREIALEALGLDPEGMAGVRRLAAPGNTAVSVVQARPGRLRLVSYNDMSHVREGGNTALDG